MKAMNLFWTLAFACAAVSCSDDMNDPGDKGIDEKDGQKAYVKISISTVSDVMGAGALKAGLTRAGEEPSNPNGEGAGWGEDGNGWLSELDNSNEAKIHDINIFLVAAEDPNLTGENQLDNINKEDAASVEIVGWGYLNDLDNDANGGTEPNHDHAEEIVQIKSKTPMSDEEKHFFVYTIVNAGEELNEASIATLDALRNYAWEKVVATDETDVKKADNFVMSTHKMLSSADPKNHASVVSLSTANTKNNPARTSVYVERLAARIDLAYSEELDTKDASADVKDKGKFTLTGYMVVNQWQGATNMFKQVTPEIADYTKDVSEGTYTEMQPRYLGDEVWKMTVNGQPEGKYNFVWSQEFYDKTEAAVNDAKWNEKYKNHFNEGQIGTNSINAVPTTKDNISYKLDGATTYYPITYVRENTTNTSNQLNGYSTGMIFRTQFAPNEEFKVSEYSEGAIKEITLTDPYSFFTAEHSVSEGEPSKVVYKDLKSVAARAFNIVEDTKNLLKGFMQGWDFETEATLQDAKDAVDGMSMVNGLEKKFHDYLDGKLKEPGVELTTKITEWEAGKDDLCYSKFVENESDSELFSTESFTDNQIATLIKDYQISYFKNGESYHKYWIRHDSNNDTQQMGAMEFAIVRNNVYLLNVTGIRDLGDPLPYVPGKDDPGTPDEETEITIDVTVYIMDWVKRKNKDIIL